MTGRTIEYVFPPTGRADRPAASRAAARSTGLTRAGEFADVSLTVHGG